MNVSVLYSLPNHENPIKWHVWGHHENFFVAIEDAKNLKRNNESLGLWSRVVVAGNQEPAIWDSKENI